MKKKLSALMAVILAAAVVLCAAGCKKSSGAQSSASNSPAIGNAKNLLDEVEMDNSVEGMIDDKQVDPLYTGFAVKLAQNADKKGENLLISPISVAYGLTLTANGAHGETLTEFEKTLGGSTYTLNRYFYYAMEGEYQNDSARFKIGNSLWIDKSAGYNPEKKYLVETKTFFDASIFSTDFANAEEEIGEWLKSKGFDKNTKFLPAEADKMISVNSLMFSAVWKNVFDSKNTKKDKFMSSDGNQTDIDFLNGIAERYLKDDKSEGFTKEFKGGNYGLAVIIPNEGVSVEDYLKSISGSSLITLFTKAQTKNIGISMPKFELTSDLSLKEAAAATGIKDAFDSEKADFITMGSANQNLYLSDVVAEAELKLSEISVNSSSVKADNPTEIKTEKQIKANRPFVYVIYDLGSNIPKYIGAYKTTAT